MKVHIFLVKKKTTLLFGISARQDDFFFFLLICIFLFWSSCPFSKTKKMLEVDGVCWWAHNNVNTINAIELYIQKWLKWQISWHVQLTTIKNKGEIF